jgi:hypothetical protein
MSVNRLTAESRVHDGTCGRNAFEFCADETRNMTPPFVSSEGASSLFGVTQLH